MLLYYRIWVLMLNRDLKHVSWKFWCHLATLKTLETQTSLLGIHTWLPYWDPRWLFQLQPYVLFFSRNLKEGKGREAAYMPSHWVQNWEFICINWMEFVTRPHLAARETGEYTPFSGWHLSGEKYIKKRKILGSGSSICFRFLPSPLPPACPPHFPSIDTSRLFTQDGKPYWSFTPDCSLDVDSSSVSALCFCVC